MPRGPPWNCDYRHADDRRHRVRNLEPGDNIQYDDQKQEMWLKRDVGGPKKAVLRHTKFEEEQQQGGGQGGDGQGGQQQKKGRDLKTEPTVNWEGAAVMIVIQPRVAIAGP